MLIHTSSNKRDYRTRGRTRATMNSFFMVTDPSVRDWLMTQNVGSSGSGYEHTIDVRKGTGKGAPPAARALAYSRPPTHHHPPPPEATTALAATSAHATPPIYAWQSF